MNDGPLYNRYLITHKDGQPINPDKRYFVLDMSHPDERDMAALLAYIEAARFTDYEQLADDMQRYLNGVIARDVASLAGQPHMAGAVERMIATAAESEKKAFTPNPWRCPDCNATVYDPPCRSCAEDAETVVRRIEQIVLDTAEPDWDDIDGSLVGIFSQATRDQLAELLTISTTTRPQAAPSEEANHD